MGFPCSFAKSNAISRVPGTRWTAQGVVLDLISRCGTWLGHLTCWSRLLPPGSGRNAVSAPAGAISQ
eukprot:2710394-Rhodomonas_salina.2